MKLSVYEGEADNQLAHEDLSTQPIQPQPFGLDGEGSAFGPYLYSLKRHWSKLALFCACSLFVCYVVSKRITPMYEATSVIEFNRETPSGVVGQDATRAAWNDSDQFLATQIKVLQEDSVLRPIVERYRLNAGQNGNETAPMKLKELRVTRPANTYLVQIGFRSTDPVLAANVANGIADSYLKHIFRSRLEDIRSQSSFMERQLDEMRAAMERSSMAVSDFERRQGVIDPQEKTDILSSRLMQLNTEYTTAQADRIRKEADYDGLKSGSLAAAQQSDQGDQLKGLQESLNEARRKFTDIKSHYGAAHPEYARQAALIVELQSQLDNTRASVAGRTEVSYQDAVRREGILKGELSQAKEAYDDLNGRSFQYQTLKSEAETNRKLYNDLEQRIKEAGINANFQNSSTQISDLARPALKALYPILPLNLGLTFAFSLLAGLAAIFVYDSANDKVQDASQISAFFHAEVLGAVPSFKSTSRQISTGRTGSIISISQDGPGTEPAARPDDQVAGAGGHRKAYRYAQYQEAIKMLWSSFQLTNFGNKYRSLMITSAVSGEGKTTISSHFALTNARYERKTLLIDADLRRPSAHRDTNVQLSPGMADALAAPKQWRSFIQVSPLHPNLHILSAGRARRGSADELIRLMPQIIAEAEGTYDLVVIDTPPILSFAETMHIATQVDGVMVVACSGKTSRGALRSVLQTLGRLHCTVSGIVLNRVQKVSADNYYSYSSYTPRDLEASA